VTEEQRSPLDSALDLFVYAPVGLALTAMEELPKLAEKGRAQVKGQITIARMVGQFAVAQGRKQIEKRLGADGRPSGAGGGDAPVTKNQGAPAAGFTAGRASSSRVATPDHATNGASALHSELTDVDGGYERLSGRADEAEETGFGSVPSETAIAAKPSPGLAGASPNADDLAIPGYDSLSASQVVQRLAGLSKDELDAVGSYESAHRARRTILTRVNQLKA
jgi:hypothetical protein